jgi:hypothetical protein
MIRYGVVMYCSSHIFKGSYRMNILERNDSMVYDDKVIKITTFSLDHIIVKPSPGYKTEFRNKSFLISGDMHSCDNMACYSSGLMSLLIKHTAISRFPKG